MSSGSGEGHRRDQGLTGEMMMVWRGSCSGSPLRQKLKETWAAAMVWWDIHSLEWEMARPGFLAARVKGGCVVKGSDEAGLWCYCVEEGVMEQGMGAVVEGNPRGRSIAQS